MVIWDLATILNHIKQLDDKPLKLLYKHQDERTKQWKYLIKSYGSWKLEIYFFIKTPFKKKCPWTTNEIYIISRKWKTCIIKILHDYIDRISKTNMPTYQQLQKNTHAS